MKRLSPPAEGTCAALALALTLACSAQVGSNGSPGSGPGPTGSGSTAGGAGASSGTGAASGGGAVSGGAGATGAGGSAVAGDPTAAGIRPLHLLSAKEYLNTVRDLLGDTTTMTTAGLPTGDEDPGATSGFAFHVDHDVATQDATLLESAAESLTRNALTHLTALLPCATPPATGAEGACLSTFMTTFMPKAYRRPLSASETSDLMALYTTARGTLALGFNDAIGVLIEATLQSPGFLYHWELDPGPAVQDGAVVKLGSYELANRLSYFLWETMPDATLFSAAAANQLGDVPSVTTQVRRMLADPKAGTAFVDFVTDWLDVDTLPSMAKDPTAYAMFNDSLVSAMTGELQSFVSSIVMNGSHRLGDLLTGTNSFANQALASLYGLTGVTGTALKAVMLNPAQRAGLLTQAAFLATTGDTAESNPPRRGRAIYTKLLCGAMPPPPNNVPPPDPPSVGGTLRQRMEKHDLNMCAAGCHTIIEPFGFAFEEYGGIGEFRTTDNNAPVDSSGTLTLDGKSHTYSNAPDLVTLLAASPTVQSCFTTQWIRYGFGRLETPADQASIIAATMALQSSTGDMREMLVGLSTSRTFRYRTPAPGEVLQ